MIKNGKLKHLITLALLFPLSTYAVTPGQVLPATVEPSRAGDSLKPLTQTQPSTGGGVSAPAAPTLAKMPQAEKITLVLRKLVIHGSTVYSDQALEKEFQPYINKKITLAQLFQIAQTITLKYRNDGYILSKAFLPAQKIVNGVVKIEVIEGYIADVAIEGNPKNARDLLSRYGDRIKNTRPTNMKTLERFVLLANDIPGMSVKTVLRPSTKKNEPGAVNLVFVAEESTASGFVSYDNRGTRYLGPEELSVGAAINSAIRSGEQIGVQALTTPGYPYELQYYSLYTQQPLGSNGTTLNVAGNFTHNRPQFILAPLNIEGQSVELVTTLSTPVIRSRSKSLFVSGILDILNNRSDTRTFGTTLYNDHIRSLRAGGTFYLNDSLFGGGANQLQLQASQGLPIFNASPSNSTTLSRVDGDPFFTKINYNVSRTQAITERISILASSIGQYAFNPLLTSEQFSYGGAVYGLAYDPAEITGDSGIAAKAELRYDAYPAKPFLSHIQYFTSYDIGAIRNKLPITITGLPQSQSGSSVAIGARGDLNRYMSTSLLVAKPLTHIVATKGNKDWRLFFTFTIHGETPGTESAKQPTPGAVSGAATQAIAPYVR